MRKIRPGFHETAWRHDIFTICYEISVWLSGLFGVRIACAMIMAAPSVKTRKFVSKKIFLPLQLSSRSDFPFEFSKQVKPKMGAMFWKILRWLAMALYACSGHYIWLACGHAMSINKRSTVYGGIRPYSDSKDTRVVSISNRCRSEDLCYLGSLTIGGRSKISTVKSLI